AMEAVTDPPLESSTTVAPPRSRPRPKSSKSFGLSEVTMPTALTQPRQFGSQATQLNFIGSLRSSSVPPARAELPSVVTALGTARDKAAKAINAQPRGSCDLKSVKPVPSQAPQSRKSKPHFCAAVILHIGVIKMVSGRLRI